VLAIVVVVGQLRMPQQPPSVPVNQVRRMSQR
jgi:hypothetical protein